MNNLHFPRLNGRVSLSLGLIFASLLVSIAVFTPQSAIAQTPNFVIYDDALENGGANWSWAATNLANTSPVHSGNDSISVNAAGYQALYIHENPFNTTPYSSLNFYINGGAKGGQRLLVQATVSGQAKTPVAITTLVANTWTAVSIPLSSLGVAGTANVDGFWIQDTTGTTQPTFYVDDITLISGNAPPPPTTVAIDAGANNHPISPFVYGLAFANTAQLLDLNVPINRSGGNNESGYNWQLNASDHASDWFFESIGDTSATPGERQDTFFSNTKAAGAKAALTVPELGWVAKLGQNRSILPAFSVAKYGAQQKTDPYDSDAGNGVFPNGTNITGNDPNDANTPSNVTFEQGWINHMISTWGTAANGGVSFYLMDNEPSIWFAVHRDVHPNGPSMDEIYNDWVGYGSMIKAADPNAQIMGPEEWGWSGYFYSGEDQQYGSLHGWSNLPDRTAHNNMDYVPWLLQQMQNYQTANGTRLLDYLSLHFYPQSNEFSNDDSVNTDLLRNRSTRQLWDPSYSSESWIGQPVYLIPRMKSWVNTYYPGTKTAITEYNWGDEDAMNGATTQADILGIFGQQGLDLATRWTVPDPAGPCYQSYKMYRNYDGKDSTFGDTSVSDTVPDPDNLSSFAAVRSSDGALTIMVINKWLSGQNTAVTLNLANFNGGSTAQVWQLSSASKSITQLASLPVVGNSISLSAPPQSVTLLIVPAATIAAPAAPTGLAATGGNGQVSLSWSASAGASSYNVYRATTSGGETLYQSGVSGTTFTDSTVTNGTTYYYEVTAVNAGGESAMSNEAFATPQVPAPPTPTGLSATGGNAQVSLQWSASTGATSYNIYRSTSSGGETLYQSGVNSTSYTDTGVTNGTTYYYKVTGVNAGGESGKSNEASATPQVPAPSAPTGLTATGGNAQVSLSWNASNGAATYNIYRGTTSGSETLLQSSVSGTTFTDTGVTNGTTYFYEVTAVNAGGESGKSNEASATPQTPIPGVPTGLTAVGGIQKILLSWTASTGAITYNIYRATTSGAETLYQTGITTASFTDTGLPNGTTYFYEVTAVNAGGESGKSNEASATPTAVVASAVFIKSDSTTAGNWKGVYGADGFNIITDPSANNPTMPAYATVTPSGNSVVQWSAPGASSAAYCLQAAAPGSTQRVAGAWYASSSFSVDLNLTDGLTHQVALYLLDWGKAGRSETVVIADAITGKVLDARTPASFSTGAYRVWNISGHVKITFTKTGGSNCVLSAIFFDPKPPAPPAPTGLAATGGSAQVGLSWSASAGATSYNIYRGTTSGGEGTTPYKTGATGTSFKDAGVVSRTTYFYEVTAVNANGESAFSNEASATPVAPATAVFVKADSTTAGNWKGVYGADGFNIITDPSANNPTMPAYATLTPSGNSVVQWSAPGASSAAYCLQAAAPGSTQRVAGAWYASSSFSVDLNLTDGLTHQVALYLLDWGKAGRSETVVIADAITGKVLDARTPASFSTGAYRVWNISGHVKITFTKTGGSNCVLSGIFFK
jgi:fibronectin type 3 domain-containing protein